MIAVWERLFMAGQRGFSRNYNVFALTDGFSLRFSLVAFALALLALGSAAPALAQYKAKAHVETAKGRGMLYPTSIGISADTWDGRGFDAETLRLLDSAGVTSLKFPGNNGIEALYHWSTGTVTNPYSNDKAPGNLPPQRQFAAMVSTALSMGSELVTVNYGTSLDGKSGGDPEEAAAWVAYANGKPGNPQPIGKDAHGTDWKTVGYWAGLRASSPLATDDGLNALRIGQTAPVGIQLWAIGNEVWNNGFYPTQDDKHTWEVDLHAGPIAANKDLGRHPNDSKLGPAAYGNALIAYAKAMKAVDPTIMIGASLVAPPPSGSADKTGKNWMADLFKTACGSIDFGTVGLMVYPGTAAPDYKTADEPTVFSNFTGDYVRTIQELVDKGKKSCPNGRVPQIAVTTLGVNAWMNIKHPAVTAAFAADAMATLIENGAYSVDWAPLHSNIFLDDKNQPKPAYFGLQVLHEAASTPGDQFVSASSDLPTMGIHAVKRRDGGLGLLIVNKDGLQSIKVTISVDGYNFASKGTRYDYGSVQLEAGKGVVESPIEGLGASFTIDVPRYGVTAIVIPKQ
jgi:hypothetical protein